MNFAGHTYPDIARDLLTVLTGGTAREVVEIGANPPETIALENRPVRRVSHLAGTVVVGRGEAQRTAPYRFTEKDFDLVGTSDNPTDKVAIRLRKPHRLAPFSTLTVNYYPERLRPTPLTDVNVGSVARTLMETVARELATQYQQLQIVYDSAFVESAAGPSLDKVAALVDVRRITRGAPVGRVRFTRASGSAGQVFIPLGSVVTDGKGARYHTTAEATLLHNQGSVEVWVHGESVRTALLPAGALFALERAIAGVAVVSNDEPTFLATDDETDKQLADRTRRAVHVAGRGTRDAVRFGLESLPFVAAVALSEYPDPAVPLPGALLVSVALRVDTPANRDIVDRRIEELRPAGIFIDRRWAGSVRLAVTVDLVLAGASLPASEQAEVEAGVRAALTGRIAALAPGAPLRAAPLLALVLADTRIVDARIALTADGAAAADGYVVPADKAARLDEADIAIRPPTFELSGGTAAPVAVHVDLQGRFSALSLTPEGAEAGLRERLSLFLAGLAPGSALGFDAIAAAVRNDQSWVLDLDQLVFVVEPQGSPFTELRRGDAPWTIPAAATLIRRGVAVTGPVA